MNIANEKNQGLYTAYPFSGIPTFIRTNYIRDQKEFDNTDFDIAIMGVPFDEGMPFIPGARFGPRGIREQSLRFSKKGYYNVDEDKIFLAKELQENRIVDLGDIAVVPTDIEGSIKKTSEMVRKVLHKKALLIVLGGDHSITFPVLAGYDALGEDFHVVQFDSHPDYSDINPGFEYTNSHPFRHIRQMKYVKSLTQVGIRSVRSFNVRDSIADGNRVVSMTEFRKIGPDGVAKLIPEGESCYVSIDIDALDCSLVPGCVSAEPNGLMFAELRDSLAAIAKHNRVVGFDLVEVAPPLDIPTKITSFIGTQIVVEFLGRICDQPYWKERYES